MSRLLKIAFVGLILAGCIAQQTPIPPRKTSSEMKPDSAHMVRPTLRESDSSFGDKRVNVVPGADGCWRYKGRAYEYVLRVGQNVRLSMEFEGAVSGDTENSTSAWEYRNPVAMPLEGVELAGASDTQLAAGNYLLTFSPRSSFGWMGRAKVCVYPS